MFYAGLVRTKNVLSILMQCFAITCVVSLLWLAVGYSLAFSDGGSAQDFIGGLDKAFLAGVARESVSGTIPESVFFMFQMTFAIITPALVIGGFAERMRFSAVLWFHVAVAAPGVCADRALGVGRRLAGEARRDGLRRRHRGARERRRGGAGVRAGAWAAPRISANGDGAAQPAARRRGRGHAVGGLVRLQRRQRARGQRLRPAWPCWPRTWVPRRGALAWMIAEWTRYGKPSMLGVATGMVAGLGTITPASGFVGPMGAVAIGLAAGTVCFFATQLLKRKLEIDDSLDVSPVHGVGGVLGTLLTGVFGAVALGGAGFPVQKDIGAQVGVQALGVVAAASWCAVVTWVILKVMALVVEAARRRKSRRPKASISPSTASAGTLRNPSFTGELPMPRAIRIHEAGGPEVMRLEDVDVRCAAGRRSAGAAHRHRRQLHRCLRPQRAVSAEAHARRTGTRSGRRRRGVGKEGARLSRRAIASPM